MAVPVRAELLGEQAQRLEELARRVRQQLERRIVDGRARLASGAALLESFSFERVLDRGFVLVSDAKGKPVTTRDAAVRAGAVSLRFRDGAVGAQVETGDSPPTGDKPLRRKGPGQGSLL
jgi:exodeoxyribonuclease VII large subunit